jgi:hypothetical protein
VVVGSRRDDLVEQVDRPADAPPPTRSAPPRPWHRSTPGRLPPCRSAPRTRLCGKCKPHPLLLSRLIVNSGVAGGSRQAELLTNLGVVREPMVGGPCCGSGPVRPAGPARWSLLVREPRRGRLSKPVSRDHHGQIRQGHLLPGGSKRRRDGHHAEIRFRRRVEVTGHDAKAVGHQWANRGVSITKPRAGRRSKTSTPIVSLSNDGWCLGRYRANRRQRRSSVWKR